MTGLSFHTTDILQWPVLVIFVIVVAEGVAILLWRRRVPGLTGRTGLRAASYVARYAAALEYYGLTGKEIRSHVDALRADLVSAGPEHTDEVLAGLGHPRTLAAGVTSGIVRPSYLRGLLWWGMAVVVIFALHLLLAEAVLGGFEPFASDGDQVRWSALGFVAEAAMGPDGLSTIGVGGWAVLLYPVIAFVIGSRLWRLALRSPQVG